MKMIASRELVASPAKVWRLLATEGSLVITKDGKPRGILLPTDEDTFLQDVLAQVQQRAQRAVSQIRRRARVTPAEIAGETSAARQARGA